MSDIDISSVKVMLAMPVGNDIPPATVLSLLSTQAACSQRGVTLDIEFDIGSTVFHVRSKAAHRFLQGQNNRLFMIDADMVWTADNFLRFLALSTKMDCVVATYPARGHDPPVFYVNVDDPKAPMQINEYGCFAVNGVGLGFTVVTRELVEKLSAKAPIITFPRYPDVKVPKVFRFDEPSGEARGEDMAFFSDVRANGFTVHLDPTIELGHVGQHEFRGSFQQHLIKT